MPKQQGSLNDDSSWPQPKLHPVGDDNHQASISRADTPDPTQFFIASTNDAGHGSVARVNKGDQGSIRVPDNIFGWAMQFLTDPRLPYRSWQDLARDGLVHRLYQLRDMDWSNPVMQERVALAAVESEFDQIEDLASRYSALLSRIEAMQLGIESYHPVELSKLIAKTNIFINTMPKHRQGVLRDGLAVVEKKLKTRLDTSPEQ